ncbi:GNAT family N-acetyltransferase [Deinococcus grandis]|uniref:GNAT family N-acetyltransferase n=1 Tax=Deinococcus grandis TaxID=57498 RepID=UPI001366132F|nr:GNAT family N-acetyltransferase [Deinococcus grandis]
MADLPALTDAFRATFGAAPWNEAWTDESARAALSDLLATPRSAALVAWDGAVCVGAVLGRDQVRDSFLSHEVQEMFVRPERQRGGVGRALLDAHLAAASARGVTNVSLLTARESPAEAFYSHLGFRRAGRMVLLVRP